MQTQYLTRLTVLGTRIAQGEATIMELIKTLSTLAAEDPRHAQVERQLQALSEQQQAFAEQRQLTRAALATLQASLPYERELRRPAKRIHFSPRRWLQQWLG